jgi:hypothetical protein
MYVFDQKTIDEVTPTVGISVENFVRDTFKFTVFDMSGQNEYRDLWLEYVS